MATEKNIEIIGYQTVADFALRYKGTRGRPNAGQGATKEAVYHMIKRELARAGSTRLAIMTVCGTHYVKYKGEPSNVREVLSVSHHA